jgi:type IV secretory pathway VirB3-like protein
VRAQQVAQPGRPAVVVIAMALVVVLAVVQVILMVLVVLIVGVPVVVAAGLRVAHDPRMPPEPCCSISTTACPAHLRPLRGGRVK